MKKKLKLRYGRFVFLIVSLLLFGFGIVRILATPDPYREFKEVSDQNKAAGEITKLYDEENEEQIRLLHYPQFESEAMNELITDYLETLPKENGITFLDYDSDQMNERYLSVVFHYQLMDQDKKLIKESKQCISYDTEAKKTIQIQDVFRRDYYNMVLEQFKKQANIVPENLEKVTAAPHENAVQLFYENASIQLKYKDFQKYMLLKGKGENKKPISIKRKLKIDPNKPMIALTFDDGPSIYTDEVMQVFEKHNANASFFMLGQNINNYPDTVKHMVENGFEICNHSWDHKSIGSNDKKHIRQEVFNTQDALYKLTGYEATYIRPPYGDFNNTTKQVLNQNGLQLALWNVDSEDWKNRDKQITLQRAKAGAFDGAIILFHDLYPTTLEAVKELVPYLQSEGFQLVTISELFQYKSEKTGL